MNAALATTTTDLTVIRASLLALGFKHAVNFGNGGYQNETTVLRDGILYSVRTPKGANGLAKLVFEVNPEKYRNARHSWARLDVRIEADWVAKVSAWMQTVHATALEHAAKREADIRRSREVQDRAREIRASVHEALAKAGYGSKYPVVKHDDTKIVCAEITVDVRGENAEELTRRMLALLAEYEYKPVSAHA